MIGQNGEGRRKTPGIQVELKARGATNRNGNTTWRLNTLGAIVKLEAE